MLIWWHVCEEGLNMTVHVTKLGRPYYRPVAWGIDTLEVNAFGPLCTGAVEYLDGIQQQAIDQRDALTRRNERERVRGETVWEIDGQPLLLKTHGANGGMWRWLMECPAASLRVGLGQLNELTAQVRLNAAFLWEYGYRHAWELVKTTLDDLGDFRYQPSEVHLAADIAGKPLASLKESEYVRRGHVTRWHLEDAQILDIAPSAHYLDERTTNLVVVRYREPETFSFSQTAPHSAAVYNKPREIRTHSRDKLWFAEIWRAHGWDGKAPIVRVEMRYDRAVLHSFGDEMRGDGDDREEGAALVMGIETLPVLFANLDRMWQYSTQKWLRHTVPNGCKDRSKWPTSPWWRTVQSVTFEQAEAAPFVRNKQRAYHKDRIISTVLGYLESLTAWMTAAGELPQGATLEDALVQILDNAESHYLTRDSDFIEQVMAKLKKIGVAS
jgi:hypothetical protein